MTILNTFIIIFFLGNLLSIRPCRSHHGLKRENECSMDWTEKVVLNSVMLYLNAMNNAFMFSS